MKRYQRGMSLLELMLALALAMALLAAVLPVFLGALRLTLAQEQQQAVQQDARLALAALARDLRMAGHFGCASLGAGATLTGSVPWAGSAGFSADGEALRLQYGQAGAVLTSVERDAGGLQLRRLGARITDGSARLGEARFLALASCQRVDLLDAAAAGHRVGDDGYSLSLAGVAIPLADHPVEQLELLRLVSRAYVVGRYGGRQGLFLFELGDNGNWQGPIELAPGVTALTVETIRPGDCTAARLWQVTLEIGGQDGLPLSDGSVLQRRYRTRVAGRGGMGCSA